MNQDESIPQKIKKFLAIDAEFRNPNFDPAPFIIQILKEKDGNQEDMIDQLEKLIQVENQAQDLIQEIASQYSQNFEQLVQVPKRYGEQLEKLKSNISIVRKKVKQTKALLQITQKDILQIHRNCKFNKLVYAKLKELELKLQQYQAASLALKNNQFLTCSLNLSIINSSGNNTSILESALVSRSETLRLRMLSRAIEQVNNFIYFTSKVVLPSTNMLLQRTSSNENIISEQKHAGFYKRYQLFKKVKPNQYLNEIWKFDDLIRKVGKIGFIFDVIKAVINIGKIQEISESIKLNCRKSVANIFLLLQYFFTKQGEQVTQQVFEKTKWFFVNTEQSQLHITFVSAVLSICGAMLRKIMVIRKIYKEFEEIKPLQFNSLSIFKIITQQLKIMFGLIYFPHLLSAEIIQSLQEQIMKTLLQRSNYIYYGYLANLVKNSLIILTQNLIRIQEQQFHEECKTLVLTTQFLDKYNQSFFIQFHENFRLTLLEIFNKDNRPFTIEYYQSIVQTFKFSQDQLQFSQGYISQDKKAIKQFMLMMNLLNELHKYFITYFPENMLKCYRYNAFALLLFYLKINSHLHKSISNRNELEKIIDFRKKDKKYLQKQAAFRRIYYKLVSQNKMIEPPKLIRNNSSTQEDYQFSDFNTIDRLKVFKKQIDMLLSFSANYFQYIENFINHDMVPQYQKTIVEHLQGGSYQTNLQAKLIRIWDKIPQSQEATKQAIAAIFQKLINLQLNIYAKICMQTGIY